MPPFRVIEHVIPGQYVREHAHATRRSQEATLRVAIKQYIPFDLVEPAPANAITIVAAHGIGFPKETYEPLWEDLCHQLRKRSMHIRSIWMADVSNQGASGVLNEHEQGDSTNWYDHSRDLLCMINLFRKDMARPIIGLAHSMGCAQLVYLSTFHPRLFSTLILIEPVIFGQHFDATFLTALNAKRRDLWPSRAKAETAFRKGLSKWDSRALDKYLQFGLRPVPTPIYDPAKDSQIPLEAVTLTTTKYQEGWAFLIPNFEAKDAGLDDLLLPDWVEEHRQSLLSRPECWSAMTLLPLLRPSVLWVFGGESYLTLPGMHDAKMQTTGTGVGGNGGAVKGKVEKVVLEKGSHLLVFEEVAWCAEVASDWIERWFNRWLEEEKFWREYKNRKSDDDMLRFTDDWIRVANMMQDSRRPGVSKGKL